MSRRFGAMLYFLTPVTGKDRPNFCPIKTRIIRFLSFKVASFKHL